MSSPQPRALIVDDEGDLQARFGPALEAAGFAVVGATVAAAAAALREGPRFRLAFVELDPPATEGLAALRRMAGVLQRPSVIVATAHGEVSAVIEREGPERVPEADCRAQVGDAAGRLAQSRPGDAEDAARRAVCAAPWRGAAFRVLADVAERRGEVERATSCRLLADALDRLRQRRAPPPRGTGRATARGHGTCPAVDGPPCTSREIPMREGARVLIADDERNIRLTLRTAIEALGVAVDEASDGPAALARCEAAPPDLVLLDLRMPGMDGLEVLRRLRVRRPEVRVVVVTAHGTVDAAVEAMKLGAVDFLQKPFEPDEVRDLVRRALAVPADGTSPGTPPETYEEVLAAARSRVREHATDAAEHLARRALAIDPSRPQAHHLLGAIQDLRGDRLRAQAFYRAALALDPTHRPSEANLDRALGAVFGTPLLLGDEPAPPR